MIPLADVWARKGLLAAQLAGNALLLLLGYWWLSLPDRTVWQVALSVFVALVIIFAALWLHAAALAAFHPQPPAGGLAWKALRRLPLFMICLLLLAAVSVALLWLASWRRSTQVGVAALALALLPLISQAAGGGFSVRAALRIPGQWRYWPGVVILVFAGAYIPYRLIWWIPELGSFGGQAASVAARFGLAYVLAVTAWFSLAALIGRLARRETG
ncbi:MAG: hypothetical protein AAB225_21295 [Acidobacteriota bacterium]|mgnify:CR=1 FL=1